MPAKGGVIVFDELLFVLAIVYIVCAELQHLV